VAGKHTGIGMLLVLNIRIERRDEFLVDYTAGREEPASEAGREMDVSADFRAADRKQAHCVSKIRLDRPKN
jgi:hypothetical protein